MNSSRWKQVREVLYQALGLPAQERPAFLETACSGDTELRKEVDSLLSSSQSENFILDNPVFELREELFAPSLQTGQIVSHYEILDKIGEGGMGSVFKARDRRLNRIVALKVLHPETAQSPDRQRRFIQEARAASALNHPNIVTIYDLLHDQSNEVIVMEYIDGKSLDRLINHEPLPLSQLLHIAIQISEALSKAHSAGIVHRDLKPANILVAQDNFVKVLDFGIAKLIVDSAGRLDVSPKTEDGALIGTASYMSPEQAEGRAIDARSDIFSFGSLLYEMATGQMAFRGDSTVAILSAVLRDDPPPMSPDLPMELATITAYCYQKDPSRRFQTMTDVKEALERVRGRSVPITQTGMKDASPRTHSFELPELGGHTTIAVLPLRSLSNDTEDGFMAEGIAHEITGALSTVPGIRVVPHLSSFRFKDHAGDLREVAAALRCRYVVTGTLRRMGTKLRILAELADGHVGQVIWTHKYDRSIEDLFEVQDEITRNVTGSIGGQVRRATMEIASRAPAEGLDAWGLTRKAFHFWNHAFRLEGVTDALNLLRRAVQLDPNYAVAHAYLGLYLIQRVVGFISERPMEEVQEALAAAERAWELSPNDPEVLENCGLVWYLCGQYERSIRALKRSVEISPHNLVAWGYVALAHAWAGGDSQVKEARAILERLILDSPDHPSFPYWHYFLHAVDVRQSRYEEALKHALVTIEIHPMYILARVAQANALGLLGRYQEARQSIQNTKQINPGFDVKAYEQAAYVVCSAPEKAECFLEGLRKAEIL